MPTHEITLDIKKRKGRVPPRVVVRVGDIASQTISAQITSDGQPYTSSLSSVRLDILHDDGTWARCTATKSGSKASCTLPSQAVSSSGTCRLAHFVFYSGSTKAESTEGFELVILPNVDTSDAKEEAQNYDDLLTKLWEKWDAYEKQAEASESARVSAENTRKSQESARVSAENTRKDNEEQRKTASQQATSAANTAASSANAAASRANGAADDATAAAQNALNIANSIAAIEPPSGDEVTELRQENDVLATRLADVGDAYIVMRETAYMPANRKAALASEQVTVNQASVSSETATLN